MATTTTTDNPPPARLLRIITRARNAAVWGFPFDTAAIMANFNKTPHPEDPSGLKSIQYARKTSLELRAKCGALWCSPGMISTPVSVRPCPRNVKYILAFIRCTRREDGFLPPLEIVEEMKAIFVEAGYTEEPGWFVEFC